MTAKKQDKSDQIIESIGKVRATVAGMNDEMFGIKELVQSIRRELIFAKTVPPKEPETRYCEDCKWCLHDETFKEMSLRIRHAKCAHPANGGAVRIGRGLSDKFCSIARSEHGPCSADGKLFEPKPAWQIVIIETPRKRRWHF